MRDIDLEQTMISIMEWAKSKEGQETIGRGIREAEEIAKQFRDARFISHDRLHEPMTL